MNFNKYNNVVQKSYFKRLGKVINVVGLTIESNGPDAKLDDLCRIIIDEEEGKYVHAEVIGFKDGKTLLMPFDSTEGIGSGCVVENLGYPLSVSVGEEMLGMTLDGIGRPINGEEYRGVANYPIEAPAPDPLTRVIISEPLPLGVKAVDGIMTLGKGQRIGIFAGSGVGKSTLLGMFEMMMDWSHLKDSFSACSLKIAYLNHY